MEFYSNLLKAVKKHPKASNNKLALVLKCKKNKVKDSLKFLEKKGCIKRHFINQNSDYHIAERSHIEVLRDYEM